MVLCGIIVATIAFCLGVFEASDGDLGFHLATGRAILAQGRWLDRNVLTFVDPAPSWVLQQGVPAVLFELIHRSAGISGLILAKAAIVAVTFSLVHWTGVRLGARPVWAAAVTLLGAWACAFRFVERPLLFSNLALAYVGWALAGLLVRGRAGGGRALLHAGAAGVAACHLHAGAVFVLLAILLHGAALLAEGRWRRWAGPVGEEAARLAPPSRATGLLLLLLVPVIFVVAGATLALYHPYPLRVLEVPFVMGADAFLAEHLIEFRGPWRFPLALMKVFWAYLAIVVVVLLVGLRRVPLVWLLPPLAFAALALRFVRFCDLLAIASAPVAAALLDRHAARLERAVADVPRSLGAVALTLVAVLAPFDHWSLRAPRLGYSAEAFGEPVLDRVRALGLRGRAFVSDAWAGPYLAWFYPPERVYFFPAFDAFPASLYREYVDIRYGRPGWDAHLDARGIELVVLKYTSPQERLYQQRAPNLRQHLARDPRWALVYLDDLGEIFVRAEGVNAAPARDWRLDGVDPDAARVFGDPAAVLARIGALRSRAPEAFPQGDRLEVLIQTAQLQLARQGAGAPEAAGP